MKSELITNIVVATLIMAAIALITWSIITGINSIKQTARASQECHNLNGVLLTEANGELVCVDIGHYYPDKL